MQQKVIVAIKGFKMIATLMAYLGLLTKRIECFVKIGEGQCWGLGSNGTAKSLKTFPLFLMALTHHALLHRALQMNNAQAY